MSNTRRFSRESPRKKRLEDLEEAFSDNPKEL